MTTEGARLDGLLFAAIVASPFAYLLGLIFMTAVESFVAVPKGPASVVFAVGFLGLTCWSIAREEGGLSVSTSETTGE